MTGGLLAASLLLLMPASAHTEVDGWDIMPDASADNAEDMSTGAVEEIPDAPVAPTSRTPMPHFPGIDTITNFATAGSKVGEVIPHVVAMTAEAPPGTMQEVPADQRAKMNDFLEGKNEKMTEPNKALKVDRELPTAQEDLLMNNADKIPPAIGIVTGYKPPCIDCGKKPEPEKVKPAPAPVPPVPPAQSPLPKKIAKPETVMSQANLVQTPPKGPQPHLSLPPGAAAVKVMLASSPGASPVPKAAPAKNAKKIIKAKDPRNDTIANACGVQTGVQNFLNVAIVNQPRAFPLYFDPRMTCRTLWRIVARKTGIPAFVLANGNGDRCPEEKLACQHGFIHGAWLTVLPIKPKPKPQPKPKASPAPPKASPLPVSINNELRSDPLGGNVSPLNQVPASVPSTDLLSRRNEW